MVERLKQAIEKARARREGGGEGEGGPQAVSGAPDAPDAAGAAAPVRAAWSALAAFTPDPAELMRRRIIARAKTDPAYLTFDVLRTRLLKVCADNTWRRIGITSPTKGCGKTVVAANLAFSIARNPALKAALIDLDLKAPQLADYFGVKGPLRIADWLSGKIASESHFARVGDNLALGLNTERVRDSAELIQSAAAADAMADMTARLRPDIVVVDLPPVLVSDDAIATLPHLDAVVLIAAAGQTKTAEIDSCERLLADNTILLGVVLNKCREDTRDIYYEGYA